MVLAPPAPHDPYTPAPQYEDSYPDTTAPRTPAFNYVEDNKHWLMTAPGPRPLDEDMLDRVDEVYRDRLRTMLSVDDMIDHLLTRLDDTGNLVSVQLIYQHNVLGTFPK